MNPSWRKPAGIFAILAIIAIWAVLIASFSGLIARLWWPLQFVAYLVAGFAWVLPLRPLINWMETGRWQRVDRT